jgi:hypothetical protein
MDRRGYFAIKTDMDLKTITEKTLPQVQALLAMSNVGFKRDADTNGFFLNRELTLLEAKAIEYTPPEFSSRKLWTVENAGAGLKSINYAEILRSGRAKFLTDGETEVPNASATRGETPTPVRKGKIKYVITLEEMEAMARSGAALDTQKALAAKEGTEALLNDTVWFGDKLRGLKGFFAWAKDGMLNAITPVNGAAGTKPWSTKTAQEIWDDLVNLAVASETATNDTIRSNVLAVSGTNYNLLMYKKFTDLQGSGTLIQRIKETGMFDRVERCPELLSVTHAGVVSAKGVGIAFSDRSDCFKIQHPLEFTTLPISIESGFEHVVYCHADTAGLMQYRKYAGSYLTDV